MTTTYWADQPNAAVIDAILADEHARPWAWDAAWDGTRTVPRIEALSAVGAAVRHNAVVQKHHTVRGTVRYALYALTAWPESAALLDLTPDAVRTIIDTCEGDVRHQAVLLLPAAQALSTRRQVPTTDQEEMS